MLSGSGHAKLGQSRNLTSLLSCDKRRLQFTDFSPLWGVSAKANLRHLTRSPYNSFFNRRATSSAFSRLLKAETRKYPSPFVPKPLPGVITILISLSRRSNICQLVRLAGVFTQM